MAMRIDPSAAQLNAINPDRAGVSQSGAKPPVAGDEDTASLSLDAAGLQGLEATALQAPEIRADKVQALRQAITSGQYKIEPDKIADAMVSELSNRKPESK